MEGKSIAAGQATYHSYAVRRGYHIPGQQDIIGSISGNEAQNDGGEGGIDGEGELLRRSRKFSRYVNSLCVAC